VNVSLDSVVTKGQVFELNYLTGKWVDPVTEEKLLKKVNIQYVSEVMMVQARDGVQIPLRLTRLSSTKMDVNTPMLIEVYGGFDKAGKIFPQFNQSVRNLFLNKGGVYATPAIRGGGEFGDAWYKSAAGLNKMVSLNDIIDVSQFLIQNKWTSSSKVIMTGTSNGGFSVTAAALLSPQSFGLVIPVSGVYDILGINRLDPRFARGWWNDYGNPSDPIFAESIKKFSPLEIDLASVDQLPHFLFVNGLNDSRVNSLHSIKMVKKLRLLLGDTEKVNALFLKNAGHWIASQAYEDYIALRENAVVWDFVYKQLGW
jgi:prolyl oligopeptidase